VTPAITRPGPAGGDGPAGVLVVGASTAGLATAEALRARGYTGRLTLLGAEPHPPYDRPPLSKQVLSGAWAPERAHLRTPEALSTLDAELILGEAAISLDVANRTVMTATGRTLAADEIVIATGLTPRTLPIHTDRDGCAGPAGPAVPAGVHVLRTMEDGLALRADLLVAAAEGTPLVVVGDGVLAAEIAATARGLGVDVTLTGPQPAPLALQLGPLVADQLAQLHGDHGVRLRLGAGVTGLLWSAGSGSGLDSAGSGSAGGVVGVQLETGELLPAGLVVVAIGAVPVTGWLEGSGLEVANGVVCDSRCRAAEGIWAAGDVARWYSEELGRLVRLENRTNAVEQANLVAGNILGDDRPYLPVPYQWTDQYDARIQVHGWADPAAEVSIVDGSVAGRRFVSHYRVGGTVTGVLGWNMPKQARQHRQHLGTTPPVPAEDPMVPLGGTV
jgi:NADPH-dependent 2,4-dienoyl-CoA reductase/sulfur reductase-like enzyme